MSVESRPWLLQEAKKVLSQLQRNYDVLQRKFADAENRIDKLR